MAKEEENNAVEETNASPKIGGKISADVPAEEVKTEAVETVPAQEVAPQFEEVRNREEVKAEKNPKKLTASYFDGGVLELIGWKILAFIVTGVTFGLANPWAQCMLYNYRFKHTVYNGKRLKFNGTGGDLFVNMFKWIFLTIITLGIYGFFVPVRKAQWVVSNLQYEDEDFIKGDSFFDGKTIQYIGISILNYFIIVLSFGLLTPLAECIEMNWICKHSVISKKKLVFEGKAIGLFGYRILWALATLITFGIFGLWVPIFEMDWFAKHTRIKTTNDEYKSDKSLFIAIPIIIIAMVVVSCSFGALTTLVGTILEANGLEFEDTFQTGYSTIEESKKHPIKSMINVFFNDIFPLTAMKQRKVRNRSFEEEINQKMDMIDHSSEYKKSTPVEEPISEPEPEPEPEPANYTTIGGYTVHYGTYYGTTEQGWIDYDPVTDEPIMSSRTIPVTVVFTENSITLDGYTQSYSVSGSGIYRSGDSYPTYTVVGNDQIRYEAETCPVLRWQGY